MGLPNDMPVHEAENCPRAQDLVHWGKISAHDRATSRRTAVSALMDKELATDQHHKIFHKDEYGYETQIVDIISHRGSTEAARKHYCLYGYDDGMKTMLAENIAQVLNCAYVPPPAEWYTVRGVEQFYILEWNGAGGPMSFNDILDFTCGDATRYGRRCRADAQLILITDDHPFIDFGLVVDDREVGSCEALTDRFDIVNVDWIW